MKKKNEAMEEARVATYGPYVNGDDWTEDERPLPEDIATIIEAVNPHANRLLKELSRRGDPPYLVQAQQFFKDRQYETGVWAGFTRDSESLANAGLTEEHPGEIFKYHRIVLDIENKVTSFEFDLLVYAENESSLLDIVEPLFWEPFAHDDFYRWVRRWGQEFFLSTNQALVVQHLDKRHEEDGIPWVHKEELLEAAETSLSVDKPRRIFTHNLPAYRALIESNGKGYYRLKKD